MYTIQLYIVLLLNGTSPCENAALEAYTRLVNLVSRCRARTLLCRAKKGRDQLVKMGKVKDFTRTQMGNYTEKKKEEN